MGASTVASSHVSVTLGHSPRYTEVTVFPVHVVCTGTRVITKPDTKVLNFNWRLFGHMFNRDDFSGSLLELLQLTQEVPKTRFRHNLIGSEDSHFIERSGGLLFCGQFAPDNFVLLQLKQKYINIS